MDRSDVTLRPILLGHLTITVPALAVVPLVVYWSLYQFGASLWPYYISGGLAIAWQWYSMGLPRWKGLLTRKGVQENETEEVARRGGLAWPGAAAVGPFALHTTAAAMCGIFLGPWLLSRWFVWILPLLGISTNTLRADYWLQHLEVVSIIPALPVGYVGSRYCPKLGMWAWSLPTIILSYKLLTFINPHASVLASESSSGFSYYFVIERFMPTFNNFRGSDPVRVAAQMTLVAPFYSGIAYSIGALTEKYNAMERIISCFLAEREPEVFGAEEARVEWIEDVKEHPTRERK
jgi:hypothetical protein